MATFPFVSLLALLWHWSHWQEGKPEQWHCSWQVSAEVQSGVTSAESPAGLFARRNATRLTKVVTRRNCLRRIGKKHQPQGASTITSLL